MIAEIRFYSGIPTAEGVNFSREYGYVAKSNVDYIECNNGKSIEATWSNPGPVQFNRSVRKCMLPFLDKVYHTLDELAVDIRCVGHRLVDMRRTIGVVRDIDHFYELFETHTLERFRSETIFIRWETDGTHGDIWQLSELAFENIHMHRLVKIGRNTARQTYILARRTAYELVECIQKSISASFRSNLMQSEATPRSPIYVITRFPIPTYAAAEQKPKKGKPTESVIFAYDDKGKPITERDITLESTRATPRSMPLNLIPDCPDGCSDDQWEKLMLAEQIKFRRRIANQSRPIQHECLDRE